MPGSENPVRLPLGRAYWAGFAAACAIVLGIAALNVFIDPTGAFGLNSAHALNRTMPANVLDHVRRGAPTAVYRRIVRESGADVFLIGPSRAAVGFDTCRRPEVLRLAGSSWGPREMATAAALALERRREPAVLLIEVGLPLDDGGPEPDGRRALVNAALSPRSTLFSLQTIAASLSGDDQPGRLAACGAEVRIPDWQAAARNLEHMQRIVDVSPASARRGRAIVDGMVEAADDICRSTGVRHTLILFALPPTPPHPAMQGFTRRVATGLRGLSQDLKRSRREGGCRVIVHDMIARPPGPASGRALWNDRSEWVDYTHFSPRLGALALEELLAVAAQ